MSLVKLPRIHLGNFPTLLQELPNLSATLKGPRILIKREDLTGLAMGGNKCRELEFLMAYIKQKGFDAVISTADSQSNWCCQLAAACRKLNMVAGFVQFRGVHHEMQGNQLLHNIMGSEVRLVEGNLNSVSAGVLTDVNRAMNEMAGEFRKRGHNPVVVASTTEAASPYGPLIVCGWVDGAEEIEQQLRAQNINAQYVVLAQHSGQTAAGLILGFKLLKLPIKVIGISVMRDMEDGINSLISHFTRAAKFLGKDMSITPSEVMLNTDYRGEGYGIITKGCIEAIKLVAETEGIFLDPVYTGKAMAGLIDLVRKGQFTPKDTVVFIHTGGIPALFVYAEELTKKSTRAILDN